MRIADLLTLYDYNYWATEHILRTTAQISNEQFTAPTRFPRGSLRATLVHILTAEGVWLDFWQGKPRQPFLTENEFPDLTSLRERWREKEAELRAYLATVSDTDFDRPFTHVSPSGGHLNYTAPLWVFMIHPVNHGTVHRSECAQILTEYGQSPGDFDLMFYLNGDEA
jgi:uncharacterized damage-inducible protein DinB